MSFVKGFKQGMQAFGYTISVLVNTLLLLVVYFVGVGIVALFTKLFRKKLLYLKPDKNAKTYWTELGLRKRPIEEHYRQF